MLKKLSKLLLGNVDISAIPKAYQHPEDDSVMLLRNPHELHLGRDFKARAAVLADGNNLSADDIATATRVMRQSYSDTVLFQMDSSFKSNLAVTLTERGLPESVASHIESRADTLWQQFHGDEDYDSRRGHLVFLHADFSSSWHRDSEGPIMVETLKGKGTRWASPWGQYWYEVMPTSDRIFNDRVLEPYEHEVQEGQAIIFNFHADDTTLNGMRYRRLVHAGPQPSPTAQRLAYAIYYPSM